jgi:hypothetical protein
MMNWYSRMMVNKVMTTIAERWILARVLNQAGGVICNASWDVNGIRKLSEQQGLTQGRKVGQPHLLQQATFCILKGLLIDHIFGSIPGNRSDFLLRCKHLHGFPGVGVESSLLRFCGLNESATSGTGHGQKNNIWFAPVEIRSDTPDVCMKRRNLSREFALSLREENERGRKLELRVAQ